MNIERLTEELTRLSEERKNIINRMNNLDINMLNESVKYSRRLVEINQRENEILLEIENVVVNTYKVYIIESPSAQDLVKKRNEGLGMSQYLGLAEIDTEYYLCNSTADVHSAFDRIASDVKQIKQNKKAEEVFSPIIHFSAHGNKEVIEFTNETYFKWEELGEGLYKLNKAVGIDLEELISDFIITLSVCHGASFNKVIKEGSGTPFYLMLGAEDTIPWTDGILGFQVFFHHLIHRTKTVGYAISKMKLATDYEEFRYYSDKRIKVIEE